jgi:NADP-dependent 3-hydroxy acid dehydrogenase YdfG/acyl carrier protein
MGRTIASEMKELRCRRIDVDGSAKALQGAIRDLLRGDNGGDGEDEVAWREDTRYVSRVRLVPNGRLAHSKLTVRSDRTYLITGGLGALGLKLAGWLVERGARHIALVGRRAPSGAAGAAIAEMQRTGASILAFACDVSDAAALRQVFEQLHSTMPPLAGVAHAAGVLDDGILLRQSAERFDAVMAPKIHGAWNLHELVKTLELDFFVLVSSVAVLLGSPGQANYVAANSFLDALALYRRQSGLPGVSISLPPLAEGGMAQPVALDGEGRVRGIEPASMSDVLRFFEDHALSTAGQVALLPIEWTSFLAGFHGLAAPPRFPSTAAVRAAAPRFKAQIEAAAPRERAALLETAVRQTAAAVLGVADGRTIEARASLFELGLDSLMAVELRERLQTELGVTLASTLLFDFPTLSGLVQQVSAIVLGEELAPSADPAPAETGAAERSQELDELSDEELAGLLALKLSARGGA